MPGSGEGLRRARKTDHSEGYRGLEIHATTSPARTRQQPAWAHMQLTDRTPVAKVPLTGLSSTALLQAEVSIIKAYPILVRPHGRPAVALMVDNTEMGLETLASKGFSMISEADLNEEE